MTPPELLFHGVGWDYEGEATQHNPEPVQSGHHWTCYTLGVPMDVIEWEDGTAVADTDKHVECASLAEAVEVCRSRLRALRDELNRLMPTEVRWVPVGEVELKPGKYWVNPGQVGPVTIAEEWVFTGEYWNIDDGDPAYPGEPERHPPYIACLGSTPIRIPEPGEG